MEINDAIINWLPTMKGEVVEVTLSLSLLSNGRTSVFERGTKLRIFLQSDFGSVDDDKGECSKVESGGFDLLEDECMTSKV